MYGAIDIFHIRLPRGAGCPVSDHHPAEPDA